MTAYRRGQVLEHAARTVLREAGYEVLRSAGSKTPVDLVAFKRAQVLFVQCKLDGWVAPADRRELLRLARLIGAVPLAARWHKEGRAARVVAFVELTSGGPAGQRPWTPDHGLEAAQ